MNLSKTVKDPEKLFSRRAERKKSWRAVGAGKFGAKAWWFLFKVNACVYNMARLHEPPIIKLCLLWLTLLWKAGKGPSYTSGLAQNQTMSVLLNIGTKRTGSIDGKAQAGFWTKASTQRHLWLNHQPRANRLEPKAYPRLPQCWADTRCQRGKVYQRWVVMVLGIPFQSQNHTGNSKC